MRNESDLSKCQKTVFFVTIWDHPSIFQFRPPGGVLCTTLGPLCSLHRRRCEAPLNEAAMALEHASCGRKSLKNVKNATLSKIVQKSLASLRITQEHPPSTQDVPGTRFEAFCNFSFLIVFRPKMVRSGTSEQNSQP